MTELNDKLKKLKDLGISFSMGNDQVEIERIPSGSIGLDRILGGGYPRGRMIEFYGDFSSGKSLMAYLAIKEAQKRGLTTALVDAENSYTQDWAINLGIDPERLYVISAQNEKGAPRSGESLLEDVSKLIEAEIDLIVVDSVSALTPQIALEKALDESTAMAEHARMLSKCLQKVNAYLGAHNKTSLIFINQQRSNPNVMFGNPNKSTGGKALEFYDAIKMLVFKRTGSEFTYYKDEKNKDEGLVGQRIKITTEKNKLFRPKMSCEFDVFFDIGPRNLSVGVDTVGELLTECLKADIITRPNNVTYTYKDQNFKGQMAIMKAIKEDMKLQQELFEALGNVSN